MGYQLTRDEHNRLEITNFYNGMILSTLSTSSHDFAFGFLKRSRINGDSVFYL